VVLEALVLEALQEEQWLEEALAPVCRGPCYYAQEILGVTAASPLAFVSDSCALPARWTGWLGSGADLQTGPIASPEEGRSVFCYNDGLAVTFPLCRISLQRSHSICKAVELGLEFFDALAQ